MWHLFPKQKTWKQMFDEGMAHGQAGRLVEAETSFREAIRLAPNEPYPHYELGYTLSLMGRCNEGLEEFRRTEELCCGFLLVQTEIYICEQFLAGQIDPEVLKSLRQIQRLTDSGASHSNETVELSERVTELAPNCALGHYYLGKALLGRDPVTAEVALRHCINLSPDETTAINAKLHLGILMRDSGRLEEARKLWKSILTDYPHNPHRGCCKFVLG